MSRPASLLDRMIARLTVQRAVLEHAAMLVADRPGLVFEIGLGKARTFDHLRLLMPGREIFAFDRFRHAPPGIGPAEDHLLLGDFRESLPAAAERFGAAGILAHADFGSPDRKHDARQAAWLGPLVAALMRGGGIVVADRDLAVAGWQRLDPPCSVDDWPYFLWRG